MDRLLARTSRGRGDVDLILEEIEDWDTSGAVEAWVTGLFDFFGLSVEDLGDRTYLLESGRVVTDAFPDLPDGGLWVTFDREKALSREEIGLMTVDHPMVRNAVELLFSGEAGNASFGVWDSGSGKGILLEGIFVVDCPAPAELGVDRFLPVTPLRVVVDHEGKDWSQDEGLKMAVLRKGDHRKVLGQAKVTGEMIPKMLRGMEALAGQQRVELAEGAVKMVRDKIGQERERLEDLAGVNRWVSDEDVFELKKQEEELVAAIGKSRVRLDGVRMIFKM